LHNETSNPEKIDSLRDNFDNKIAKSIYRHSYNNLAAALEEYGFDRTLGERINETFGSKLATDEVCLCHGDFWPGNFVIDDTPHEANKNAPILTLVDWEMVRIGNGATDVGQFAAEAWLLDRTRGGKGMMESFLEAYLRNRKLSDEDKIRVVAHFGTHIAYWPSRIPWTDATGTKELISTGARLLEAVEANDIETLKKGPLKVLFES
jgi:thiamine kinase-like enzyme